MLNQQEIKDLELFACQIRKGTMTAIHGAGMGHLGGAMSMIECLAVLYGKVMNIDPSNPKMKGRDRFVLSKGHCGPSLYATLSAKGYFPAEALCTMNKGGTILPSHVDRQKTPGIDYSTGSLGQGISLAVGSALGAKLRGESYYSYCILGDGECNEGQVWEAAMLAGHQKLDQFIGFVDYNKQQLDGWSSDILDMGDIGAKFAQFGFHTQTVDGHDVNAIYTAIETAKAAKGKPSMIILNTIKGQGCTYAVAQGLCHHATMNDEQFEAETKLQDEKIAALKG